MHHHSQDQNWEQQSEKGRKTSDERMKQSSKEGREEEVMYGRERLPTQVTSAQITKPYTLFNSSSSGHFDRRMRTGLDINFTFNQWYNMHHGLSFHERHEA